jgi:glutamate-1-semialdehyde 2,1-aminomutase
MALLDQRSAGPPIPQSGTFNGSAISAAAGVASMEHLTHASLAHMEALGLDLRSRLDEVFRATGTDALLTGFGSLFNIHFSAGPVVDHRGAARGDHQRVDRLARALLMRGFFMARRGMICLSTALGTPEIEGFANAVREAIEAGEV